MKTTLLLACVFYLLVQNIFGQEEYRQIHAKQHQHELQNPRNLIEQFARKNQHKLKIGDREMPINTYNGQQPNEKQLEIIKKILIEDFLVNDDTIGGITAQWYPTIAMDGGGNFVIVWGDDRNGNSDIYYQRFNSLGTAQGVNTKANDDAGITVQYDPTIAMDGGGNFVIAWDDYRNGNSDIYYQRFNSLGIAQGVNTKANDDAGIAQQGSPSIAMDVTGNFVIAWVDTRNVYSDIYYQRYNSVGTAQGVNTKANDDTGSAIQCSPTIAMDGEGNFVIAWMDNRNGIYNADIYFQRYNSLGTAQGVNTKANDDAGFESQESPSIAIDGSGNFVIAWGDRRNGNIDDDNIYFQRYNSVGTAQGVNTKVNDDTVSAYQYYPTISMDGTGNFVIVWMDDRNGNYDIYYQRYNSSGIMQGVNTKSNDDAGSADQFDPTIVMDGVGNFVIAWRDIRNANYDIFYQRYNSLGTAQGVNIKANDDAGTARQSDPTIAIDGVGNFVIAWEDHRNTNMDIYYQRYNSVGIAQGVNTKANDDAANQGQGSPSIAIDGGGNFVIAWMDYRNGNFDIYYQRYNSVGTAQGVNTKVNDDAGSASQWSPTIAMDGGGNFVIAWMDNRNGNSDTYFQRYNSLGTAQGINTRANDDAAGSAWRSNPTISMDGGGNFVIAWEDSRNTSGLSNPDIYYQRFNSVGTAQGVNTKANDDADSASQWSPTIAMDGVGNFVIAWGDDRNGNYDIYYQRYNSVGTAQGVNTKANDDAGSADQNSPNIAMDGVGNFVIAWTDYRFGTNNPDVIGQRYFSNGVANGSNYRIVADGPNYGEMVPVAAANNNKIIFSWLDNRRSKEWDIYAKIVGWDWNGVTSVYQENNSPVEFALEQNYPNPFNPSTTFKYSIPTQSKVIIKIYDILGNEVATLMNEEKSVGTYELTWNATNLPSGVYFYQLKAVDPSTSSGQAFISTKKMILLK